MSCRSDFSTIAYTTHGSLTGERWTITSAIAAEEAFVEDLYKELNATANLTEEGTYYWRLHWKSDPNDITSANYNTSPTARSA